MDQLYGSRDRGWLSVHGGFATMGRRDHSRALEVIVIAQRKREEVIGLLTNDTTCRWSCGDGHTMALNRGSRWCFDGEIVLGARRRDWTHY
jgi:hypothetical protein